MAFEGIKLSKAPRVIKMVLIHDLVEIDAGDTFCYDEKANENKSDKKGLLRPC